MKNVRATEHFELPMLGDFTWHRVTYRPPSATCRCVRCGERIAIGQHCPDCAAYVARLIRDSARAAKGQQRARAPQIRPTTGR